MPTPEEIEAAARAIAYELDADPDNGVNGYPFWQTKWIVACATKALEAVEKLRAKSLVEQTGAKK